MLFISTHGKDIETKIDETYTGKYLVSSAAPKNLSFLGNTNLIIILKNFLIHALRQSPIYDVIDKFHDYMKINYKKFLDNVTILPEQTDMRIKLLQALNENKISRARVITNDKKYGLGSFRGMDNDVYGIYALHVLETKLTKNTFENTFDLISFINNYFKKFILESETILLSDILNICINDLDFERVIIFDMSCRSFINEETWSLPSNTELVLGDFAKQRLNPLWKRS